MGKPSAKRTSLYVTCAILFPLAFVGFVVGFAFPVWLGGSDLNFGLWQSCEVVVKNCTALDFNDKDWMIGVRAVEIFALVMFVAAAIVISYENCCTNFKARPLSERLGGGVISILGGLGGLAGIVVYVVKVEDSSNIDDYGWAFALVTASSALAVILGVGFCISGFFLEPKLNEKQQANKEQMNGRTPHLTTNDENYELTTNASRNNAYNNSSAGGKSQAADNLPGFAVYNGMMNYPGQRNSLPPMGMSSSNAYHAPSLLNGRGGGGGLGGGGGGERLALPPTPQPKQAQYYSLSDDRLLEPGFDLSEGFSYVPSRARRGQDNPAYNPRSEVTHARNGTLPVGGNRPEEAYSRGGPSRPVDDPYYSRSMVAREEDPYNRVHRGPPRAGYNDPYGFDRLPGGGGGGGGGGRGGGGFVVEGTYDRAYSTRTSNNNNNGLQPTRDGYYGRF